MQEIFGRVILLLLCMLVPAAAHGASGALVSVVHSNSTILSGTSMAAGSASVLVNGEEAEFDPARGTWSCAVELKPGFNRVLVQELDPDGLQLFVTNRDVVAELSTAFIGGTLTGETVLTSEMGVFRMTNSVFVMPGASLTIGAGCVFLVSPGADICFTNATVAVEGEKDQPVVFAPADGITIWGGLIFNGVGGGIRAKHVEVIAGRLQLLDSAQGVIEDGYFHDYLVNSPPIIHTLGRENPCALTLRRCHVSRYFEILCQLSTNVFEDCLLEYQAPGGDGIDFDGALPGSVIRRCTVRHGKFSNVDALDMGEFATLATSRGVLIESCLLYDFVDKGISMGVAVDVTVSNCLIYGVGSGIAVKDSSTAGIFNCTIVSNGYGLHCYNKMDPDSATGGGHVTNSFNNIFWENDQAVSLANGSTLLASYSDFQGAVLPGDGNVSLDPRWLNPGQGDYRFAATSGLQRAGSEGSSMGVKFPVGSRMASSHPAFNSVERSGENVVLRFWADPERSYSLLSSTSIVGSSWFGIADVFPGPIPRLVCVTNAVGLENSRVYRLVTPMWER